VSFITPSRCLNVNSDGEEVTSDGKSFHTREPVTENAATDSKSLTAGANRLLVTEDQSLCREGMSVTTETLIFFRESLVPRRL